MSIYNISTNGIEEVKTTSFQQNGILERTHLQAFLRDKIHIISPNEMQGSTGVINTMEFIEEKFAGKSRKRHFVKEEEVLISSDNVEYIK